MKRKLIFNNKNFLYLLVFLFINIFFYLSRPGNLSETDDGFLYAAMIRDQDYSQLFFSRHLLFLPLSKLFFELFQSIGFAGDAYLYLGWQSSVFASLTILLCYKVCRNTLMNSIPKALLISAMLMVSIGFWRYAVEAELYSIVLFLLLFSFFLVSIDKDKMKGNYYIIIVFLFSFVILIYKPASIPLTALLICGPASWSLKKRFLTLLMVFFITILFYLLIFELGFTSKPDFISYLAGGITCTQGNRLAPLIILPTNIISTHWLFALPYFQNLAIQFFPNKVLSEEIFTASQPLITKVYTYVLTGFTILTIMIGVHQTWVNKNAFKRIWNKKGITALTVWCISFGATLIILDPSSPEPWLLIQVPLIIILGQLLFQFDKGFFTSLLSCLFIVLLFLINLMGGMLLFKDKTYDYTQVRSKWLKENAEKEDVILTFGPNSMENYLNYYTTARVIDMEQEVVYSQELLKNPSAVKGEVYLTGEVLSPFEAIKHRSGGKINVLEGIFHQTINLDTVKSNGIFSVYRIVKK